MRARTAFLSTAAALAVLGTAIAAAQQQPAANAIYTAEQATIGKAAYEYVPRAGAALVSYNIERQAEIARHLYLARNGGYEPGMPPRGWLEDTWASR